MRSTQKYINQLLDQIKYDLDLKSRPEASVYFYSVLAKGAFHRNGYYLSYYKDNRCTITNDHINYITVDYADLWMQNTVLSNID